MYRGVVHDDQNSILRSFLGLAINSTLIQLDSKNNNRIRMVAHVPRIFSSIESLDCVNLGTLRGVIRVRVLRCWDIVRNIYILETLLSSLLYSYLRNIERSVDGLFAPMGSWVRNRSTQLASRVVKNF